MKNIEACRDDFPAISRTLHGMPMAFLDGPGGTQPPKAVINAVVDYLNNYNSNIFGNFVVSQESDAIIQKCREHLATFLGAASWRCISLGLNMTTLNFSVARALGNLMQPGDEVIITELDHEANRSPWLNLQKQGVIVKQIPLKQDGTLDMDAFERRLTDRTKLVAMGCSSNAIGTVNDVRRARIASKKVGAYLLLDAVHYAPHFAIDVQDLDCDFLLCSAYKFYGPHIGALYTRPGLLESLPVEKSNSQSDEAPYRIETGTQNHEGLNGTIAAIEYIASFGTGADLRSRIVDAMHKLEAYEYTLAKRAYDGLSNLPQVQLFGQSFESTDRAPTISFIVKGKRSDEVAKHLGEEGIFVWDGDFAAHRAMEVLDTLAVGGVVRIGISMYNTAEEIDRLLSSIKKMA
ncbi:cysteine desulfurase-like protein [Pseudomonas sp. NPDC088444]|uniref:cysteine desulfurase-like protein n=1 Tax=Pseudomonas sp. NPDC088444 TaxID=3364456 RepID=UPI00384FDB27